MTSIFFLFLHFVSSFHSVYITQVWWSYAHFCFLVPKKSAKMALKAPKTTFSKNEKVYQDFVKNDGVVWDDLGLI